MRGEEERTWWQTLGEAWTYTHCTSYAYSSLEQYVLTFHHPTSPPLATTKFTLANHIVFEKSDNSC